MNLETRSLVQRQLERWRFWINMMARRHGFEDLYQEMWVRCLALDRSNIDWREPQHRRIRAIARGLCRAGRHKKRLQGTRRFSDCGVDGGEIPDPRQSSQPAFMLDRQETRAIVVGALAQFAPQQRAAAEQHLFEAVPDVTIAARCGVSVNVIRRWRSRVLRQLRAELRSQA